MAYYIAPDYMEPLVAWRYWRLDPFASDPHGVIDYLSIGLSVGGRVKTELRSFATYIGVPNVVWPDDKPLTATCRCAEVSRHMAHYYPAVEQDTCGECPSQRSIHRPYFPCGIYGWRTRELLLRSLDEQANGTWDDGFVFGAVNLWGVVREHADGYRAQYAYPESIIFASAGAETAQAVADKYRIPYDHDMEVDREYRRAETHYYRRTGKIPHSGKVAYACDAPGCTICASPGIAPEYWYKSTYKPTAAGWTSSKVKVKF